MVLKNIVKVFLLGILLFNTYIYFFGKTIDVTQKPKKSDVIVCLGGGFVERLNKGIELYKKRFADKIIFTGSGIGTLNKDDKIGFWKAPYFEEQGVLKKDIYFLQNVENTYSEINTLKEYMLKHEYKTVLIVSDPPHSKRIQYLVNFFEYKKFGLDAKIIGSDVTWWDTNEHCDSLRSLWEAMKEILGLSYYQLRYSWLKIS